MVYAPLGWLKIPDLCIESSLARSTKLMSDTLPCSAISIMAMLDQVNATQSAAANLGY
jgi:hypothetical protein